MPPTYQSYSRAVLLCSIIIDKYVDHLPLYHQEQRFNREKIPIASSTLEGWARQSLELLDILYQKLLRETISKGYIQADESTIKVRDPAKKVNAIWDIIGFITIR